jgi:hypothetical protein
MATQRLDEQNASGQGDRSSTRSACAASRAYGMITMASCVGPEQLSQPLMRTAVVNSTLTVEHTGWMDRVHEILGFFPITFGQSIRTVDSRAPGVLSC